MIRPALPAQICDERIMAIARGRAPSTMEMIAREPAIGGIGVLEVTLDSPRALESIEMLRDGPLLIGAGTVRSAAEVVDAAAAGAEFIVSPHLDEQLVGVSVDSGIAVIPGAMTPTEIVTAWRLGASAVKVFPAFVGGPAFITAVRQPLGHIPLIPTGGVDLKNAPALLDAGAVAVGLGGWLTGGDEPERIRSRARQVVAVCS